MHGVFHVLDKHGGIHDGAQVLHAVDDERYAHHDREHLLAVKGVKDQQDAQHQAHDRAHERDPPRVRAHAPRIDGDLQLEHAVDEHEQTDHDRENVHQCRGAPEHEHAEDDAEQADCKIEPDGHALDLADEIEHDLHHTEHGHGSAENAADHNERRLGVHNEIDAEEQKHRAEHDVAPLDALENSHGISSLQAERLVDEHDLDLRHVEHLPPEHEQRVAAAALAAAVEAAAGRVTRLVAVKAPHVLHGGGVARAGERAVEVRADLVCARDDVHRLADAVDHGGEAVAAAVDVEDLAVFRNGVGAAEVHGRGQRVAERVKARRAPVPPDGVVSGKPVIQADLVDGLAAADADGGAVDRAVEIVRRLAPGGEVPHGEAAAGQRADGFFDVHGTCLHISYCALILPSSSAAVNFLCG